MRRVLLGDMVAAACCLAGAGPNLAPALARRMITEADAAHRYMKRFARPHPKWGTGSLEVRANALKSGPDIGFDLGDVRVLGALAILAYVLADRSPSPSPSGNLSLALPPKPLI